MTSINQRIQGNEIEISNLNARILAITPNNLIFAALGAFVKYGCKVTEGSDNTDLIVALEGQASGDSANLNPDLSVTPTRQFEFANIASLKGGDFVSNDTSATVTTAPTTGTSRYDIAYIFAGKEGAGFAIAAGSPSASVLSDFTANGLQTGEFGEESPDFDPSIPVGAVAVARIYVAEDVTAIVDADIADLRSFSSFQSATVAESFAVPPALGSTTPNVVNATTLNAIDGNFTGNIDISHTASPALTLSDTTTGGVSAKLQVTDTLGITGTTSDDDFEIQRNSITAITLATSIVKFAAAAAIATTLIVGSTSVVPDGTAHIFTASAGSVTAATSADDLVVENSTGVGISILGPDASTANLNFGSPSDNVGAFISWNHNNNVVKLSSAKVGASAIISGDANITNLTLAGAAGSETAVFAGTVTATDGLTVTNGKTTLNNAGANSAVLINQDANANALDIDTEATSANGIKFIAPTFTVGTGIVAADFNFLTTGRIATFQSNSPETDIRSLVFAHNDNGSAVGTTVVEFRQDAANEIMILDQNASSSFIDYQGSASANTTSPISTFTTFGAVQGFTQIEINGVKRWQPFYADPS